MYFLVNLFITFHVVGRVRARVPWKVVDAPPPVNNHCSKHTTKL